MTDLGAVDPVVGMLFLDRVGPTARPDTEGRLRCPTTGEELSLGVWFPVPNSAGGYSSYIRIGAARTFEVTAVDAVDALLETCTILRVVCHRFGPVLTDRGDGEALPRPSPEQAGARRRELASWDRSVAAMWGPAAFGQGWYGWIEFSSGERLRLAGHAPWVWLLNLRDTGIERRSPTWRRSVCHLRSSSIEALFPHRVRPEGASRTWLRESGTLSGHGRSDRTTLQLTGPSPEGDRFVCWASVGCGRWGRFVAATPTEALGVAAMSFRVFLDRGGWQVDGWARGEYSPLWSLCYVDPVRDAVKP